MKFYDKMNEIHRPFHREKKIISELTEKDLYIAPEYLEDSIREITNKNLDDKVISSMDKAIKKLPGGNFVKLLLIEIKGAIEMYRKNY